MEARFACGSMVLFFLFSQKCCTMCNIFVRKAGFFRPAGGDISFPKRDRVTPVAITFLSGEKSLTVRLIP
jgi:hypothetical protein